MTHRIRLLFLAAFILAGMAAAAHAQQAPVSESQVQSPPSSTIPALTDEDRKAAFPDLDGHTVHDRKVNYFVLLDQLEWQNGRHDPVANWDGKGWVGGDIHRLWFRTEGASEGTRIGFTQTHILYGRAFSRWWDFVAGVRQDARPGPAQTWAAVGIQGLSPYWFDIEATGYIDADGRVHARFEVEYEMLITNRLILQPLVEFELSGKSEPSRFVGSGLTAAETGLRLRYEIRREIAPYFGVVWDSTFGNTADFARTAGVDVRSIRLTAGIRIWF